MLAGARRWTGENLHRARHRLDAALNEHRIRLAVTGLSRAGKTVFITSLLQNLLALGAGRNTLPALSARLGDRLIRTALIPPGAGAIPWFDQPAHLAALAASAPAWPAPTTGIAQISLRLDLRRPGRLLPPHRVRLDIVDYPGEWLLDLPLLAQNFAQWSAEALTRLPPGPFQAFLAAVRPDDSPDEARIRRGHALYVAALHAARTEHTLRFLQPGRFLTQGPGPDAPFLRFFPLPHTRALPQGRLGALLRDRFEAYQRDMRTQFVEPHFRAFDRQIILVDVLGALAAGERAFADTRAALAAIAEHLTARRLKRVLYVATKADHVPALPRGHLRALLRSLTPGGSAAHHAIAAVNATREGGTRAFEGHDVPVVEGVILGEDRARGVFIGDVPSEPPTAEFWTRRSFTLPVFRPPLIDPTGSAGIPHLGLDMLLDDAIGDLL